MTGGNVGTASRWTKAYSLQPTAYSQVKIHSKLSNEVIVLKN